MKSYFSVVARTIGTGELTDGPDADHELPIVRTHPGIEFREFCRKGLVRVLEVTICDLKTFVSLARS